MGSPPESSCPAPPAGIWSQVKRAPKANKKRKVFEVDGPGREGSLSVDDRARQLYKWVPGLRWPRKLLLLLLPLLLPE